MGLRQFHCPGGSQPFTDVLNHRCEPGRGAVHRADMVTGSAQTLSAKGRPDEYAESPDHFRNHGAEAPGRVEAGQGVPNSCTSHTVYRVTPPNVTIKATNPANIFPGKVSLKVAKYYQIIDDDAGAMLPAPVLIRSKNDSGQGDANDYAPQDRV